MPRNFKLAGKLKWKGVAIKEPRVLRRAMIGTLVAANLVAAVMAFKPFGGSADDLRREQQALRIQLAQLQARVATSQRLVEKVETARREGDQFLAKYVTDRRIVSSAIQEELNRTAKEAGIKVLPATLDLEPIEGSDTLEMMTISAGYEGTYANLTKFVNLLDKSPRFLIIENMQTAPQQGGQALTVTLKLDTFVKETAGPPS
ncbi:MAG: GspMb/PilO family protein [Bryobacteraceae bacterium]|jgi:Tfp pilus assembly protein PilO